MPDPFADRNNLRGAWWEFRTWRDDRAWKELTDRIHAYGQSKGRTILISANGLAKYVDLQVLGVWSRWAVDQGHIALGENLIPSWRADVERGQRLAGKPVPTVLFHDWGFGQPPFPFQAVAPAERRLWMRTRGAEIFAAGAFFAFPVLGPFGCDAERDGTLETITTLSAFYRQHRGLFIDADYLGCSAPSSTTPRLSLAVAARRNAQALVLHVINRNAGNGELLPQTNVMIRLPVAATLTRAWSVSPDFAGEHPVPCHANAGGLEVNLDRLEASTVVVLEMKTAPDVRALRDPVRAATVPRWERPARDEFPVRNGGWVDHTEDLNGFLQGRLHPHLRRAPPFVVDAATEGRLLVHVRSVATGGARLEYRVDGRVARSEDVPDRDGKNDDAAGEYDRTIEFPIPPGAHRLTLDNSGGDWALIDWYAFAGEFRDVPASTAR